MVESDEGLAGRAQRAADAYRAALKALGWGGPVRCFGNTYFVRPTDRAWFREEECFRLLEEGRLG